MMLSNQIPWPGPTISSAPVCCNASIAAPSIRIGMPLDDGKANSRQAPSTRSHAIETFESTAAGTDTRGADTSRAVGVRGCCARAVTSAIAHAHATTQARTVRIIGAVYTSAGGGREIVGRGNGGYGGNGFTTEQRSKGDARSAGDRASRGMDREATGTRNERAKGSWVWLDSFDVVVR